MSRRLRGERGASLTLAMAFLALMGVFIATLLALTGATTATVPVSRADRMKLLAADGGADVGIQQVVADPSLCPAAGSSQALPGTEINGRTVDITCEATADNGGSGTPSGPTTWPIVVTGYNGNTTSSSFKTSGSTGRSEVVSFTGGPVFNAGGFSWAGGSDTFVFDEIHQHDPYCTTNQGNANPGKPTVTGTWTCENAASYPVPDPVPTLVVPTATAPAPVEVGDCKIYFPGKYTTAPSFLDSGRYYLASGVYYFEGATPHFKGQIFGGQPAPGDTQQFTPITPCATDAIANQYVPGSATGYGVELVFGGSSVFTLDDNAAGKVELFARQPANPASEGTAGVSIYAPRTAGPNYQASTVDAIKVGGTKPQMVVHGLVYTPNSSLKVWGLSNDDAGFAPIFAGGLVTGALELAINSSMTTFTFATIPEATPATERTVVVTATAQGTEPGEASVTIKAVVLVPASGSPTLLSWRKT